MKYVNLYEEAKKHRAICDVSLPNECPECKRWDAIEKAAEERDRKAEAQAEQDALAGESEHQQAEMEQEKFQQQFEEGPFDQQGMGEGG